MDMKRLSAAYVRGYQFRNASLALSEALLKKDLYALDENDCEALIQAGKAAGLKMYRFKEHDVLTRVHKVLGFLKAVMPESLWITEAEEALFCFPFCAVLI